MNRGLLDKWFDTNEEDGIPKGRGAEYPQIWPDVPMYMLYSQVNMRERFGTARDWWAHPFHFVWAQYRGAGDGVDDATGLGGWAYYQAYSTASRHGLKAYILVAKADPAKLIDVTKRRKGKKMLVGSVRRGVP